MVLAFVQTPRLKTARPMARAAVIFVTTSQHLKLLHFPTWRSDQNRPRLQGRVGACGGCVDRSRILSDTTKLNRSMECQYEMDAVVALCSFPAPSGRGEVPFPQHGLATTAVPWRSKRPEWERMGGIAVVHLHARCRFCRYTLVKYGATTTNLDHSDLSGQLCSHSRRPRRGL